MNGATLMGISLLVFMLCYLADNRPSRGKISQVRRRRENKDVSTIIENLITKSIRFLLFGFLWLIGLRKGNSPFDDTLYQ